MADEQDTPTPEEPTPEDSSEELESSDESPEQPSDEDADSATGEAEAAALAAAMSAINQVQGIADSVETSTSGASGGDGAQPFAAPEFADALAGAAKGEMALLSDVHMDVRIELGRTRMYVEDVLRLGDGAVVELDKLAGDPVDVFVNNRRVARGEVLVLNDMFCVRINEVVDITTSED
jgi:flagellar motor switch protein FliN/FliY